MIGSYKRSSCFALLVALASSSTIPTLRDTALVKRDDPFVFGTVGDSWASGVAFLDSNTYDNNKDNCLRIKEAYGAQLELDTGDWKKDRDVKFIFNACSGSRLDRMFPQAQPMKDEKPQLITLQGGGNDVGFFAVAEACIFQETHPTKSYGDHQYADDEKREGLCAKAIDATKERTGNPIQAGLENQINAILRDDVSKGHPDFKIYVIGYAPFFNEESDWCDDESFGFPNFDPSKPSQFGMRSKLSKKLRKDIDDVVRLLNDNYYDIIKGRYGLDGPVRFVNPDPYFVGHRFCEEGSTIGKQYTDPDVWLWNIYPPLPDGHENDVLLEGLNNDTTPYAPPVHPEVVMATTPSGSPSGVTLNGWTLRPFHPKYDGHTAIKQAIIDQLDADKLVELMKAAECTDVKEHSPSSTAAQSMLDALNEKGTERCCSEDKPQGIESEGEYCNEVADAEGVTAVVCGQPGDDGKGKCVSCATAAEYLSALIDTCTEDGKVSGKQEMKEEGLNLQV